MRSELVRNRGDVTKVTKEQPGTHMCSHVPCFQPRICNNSSKTEARDRLTASIPVVRVIQTLEDESVFCVPLFPHPHLQCSYVATWSSSLPVQLCSYVDTLTSNAATWLRGSYPCSYILWKPDEVLFHVDDSFITQRAEEAARAAASLSFSFNPQSAFHDGEVGMGTGRRE